jgi:hypothetical protein
VNIRAAALPASRRPQPIARPRAEPRGHLRVAPDVQSRVRARLTIVVIALVTIASLFMLAVFHAVAAESAFTLDRLARERRNEQLRYERLREEVARRSSPEAVIAEARRLGMVPASRQQFIEAPPAAPEEQVNTAPPSLSISSYRDTKGHLAQEP